jgi:DNA-binding LacI/PurR family transcriptional regulator
MARVHSISAALAGPVRTTPTIRDVASLAGVSIATVSRVINRPGTTSEATANRVRDAIEKLGFRPSQVGRSLKTARSRTIGLLVPSLANPVFAESSAGVETAAAAAGYSVLLTASHYDAGREVVAVETLLAHWVDGLVLTVSNCDCSPILDRLDEQRVPYVLLYNHPQGHERAAVTVDNVAAAAEAVGALIAGGHRRIAMVAGQRGASDRSTLRHQGFQLALARAGLPIGRFEEVDFEAPALAAVVDRLFDVPEPPTALFCGTDMVAMAAIRALVDRGFTVPDDVAVVGFDGITLSALVSPSLTSVVQPVREMGEVAVQALIDLIDGKGARVVRKLPHRMRPGESFPVVGATPTASAKHARTAIPRLSVAAVSR